MHCGDAEVFAEPDTGAVMTLPDGLYDLLLTEGLVVRLEPSHADIHALKQGAAEQLADAITRQLVSILDDMSGDEESKARRQLEIVNALLVELRHRLAAEAGEDKSGDVVGCVALAAAEGDSTRQAVPDTARGRFGGALAVHGWQGNTFVAARDPA
jgi:hypothetical protein